MAAINPDWLTRRTGTIKESADGQSWLVYLNGEPQYLLLAVPAKGKIACRISQTVNGRRLDDGATWATIPEALAGGLEELRQKLGW
jgi:hypothetical protein